MFTKVVRWICVVAFFSIFLRCFLYLGYGLYAGGLDPFDWVAVPVGLVSLYLSYMFLKKVLRLKSGQK